MGCGASKSKADDSDNPPIEFILIPDIIYGGDLQPTPPPNRKVDIYRPADYTSIDDRVKEQLSQFNTSTYETLISSLTAGCTTDLQKLRAIYVWLYLQDIHGSFYSNVNNPQTPKGYMKIIKTQNGSYTSFFAQLCRAAGISCCVIRGVGKGDKYFVGDQDVSTLESSWNAVYVAGGWRFIHPLWSFFEEKQTYENGIRPPAGTKRDWIQEFFWLVDADEFICFCKPKEDDWQLLNKKWDDKKFLTIPQFTEEYFDSGLLLPKKYNGIMRSDGGVFVVDFDHSYQAELTLDAEFEFYAKLSNDEHPRDVNMKDYIAVAGSLKTKTVAFRFPVRGWYLIDAYGGFHSQTPKIVRMLVECKHAGNDPQPFPSNSHQGFGFLPVSSQFGISDPNPDNGIVLIRAEQRKMFYFSSTQRLEIQTMLIHINHEPDKFNECVSTINNISRYQVTVNVPYDPHLEFALKIAVRPQSSDEDFTVVANYLLVDENWQRNVVSVPANVHVIVPPSKEEPARRELIEATNDDSIARLEKAIGDFEHNDLNDNGDLTRAKDKLVQLHLENLRKATSDRKLEDLEKAIDLAHKSHVAPELEGCAELAEAEMTRQQLGRLKLYLHKVLALNKSTISEMHSYQRPRPLVHQVMKATFRILGEPDRKLQNWSYVQASMRQLGHNSMLSRMRNCDVVHLKQRQINDADGYLGETSQRAVRMCSAGAGTFYIWSNNMIAEFHENNNNENTSTIEKNKEIRRNNRKGNNFNSYSSSQMESPKDYPKSRY